jgi:hypothetical protein
MLSGRRGEKQDVGHGKDDRDARQVMLVVMWAKSESGTDVVIWLFVNHFSLGAKIGSFSGRSYG